MSRGKVLKNLYVIDPQSVYGYEEWLQLQLKHVAEYKASGYFDFHVVSSGHYEGSYLELVGTRLETDEEMADRTARTLKDREKRAKRLEKELAQKRKEYAKLKKELGE